MERAADKKRISNATLGLILGVVLAIGSYFAFTKAVPWGGGTEYKAVFSSAQNLRVNSPVRIAGVNVGTVTSVETLPPSSDATTAQNGSDGELPVESTSTAAIVTMEINDEGLPLKEDTTFKLRPRLFLEGNLFVEVRPGSPGAAEQDPGQAFTPSQTSNSVQLDQVLTGALQSDGRRDLQVFLDEFGTALIEGGGAESFRTLYKTSPGSYRSTARVNEAFLGQNPHDLSGLVKGLDRVLKGLGRNELALQDTVTNLATVAGSFAAEEANLERAIIELPQVLDAADPALANLNAAFPSLRAFSREALPGTETAPETLRAATPLLKQVRLLSTPEELQGLARDLVPAVPPLARLAKRTPGFLEEGRALSSCFNNVIIPWSLDTVDGGVGYDHPAVGPVYKETGYGLAGIAGESRSQDANGQYIRIAGGGGSNTVTASSATGDTIAGVSQFPILGAMPSVESSAKTPFRPDEPCENQDTPDLAGGLGAGPTNSSAPAAVPTEGRAGRVVANAQDALGAVAEAEASGSRKAARQASKKLAEFYETNGLGK